MPISSKALDELLVRDGQTMRTSNIIYRVGPVGEETQYHEIEFTKIDRLPISGTIEYMVASKIGEAKGANLTTWNFGRGEDETDTGNVYSIVCKEDDELETVVARLNETREELDERMKKISDFAMSL